MKVVFKNGETKSCMPPIEQKVFKAGAVAGWLIALAFTAEMTSDQIDNLVTADNISNLVFTSDDGTELFSITGYEKVTSSVIRHSEPSSDTRVELQIMKELKTDAEN